MTAHPKPNGKPKNPKAKPKAFHASPEHSPPNPPRSPREKPKAFHAKPQPPQSGPQLLGGLFGLFGRGAMLTPNLHEGDPEALRRQMLAYFRESWETYERLFAPLRSQEAFITRADPLRHPLIFYYGHTAVFYINKLILGKYIHERVDPQLESICAIGVDEMSWDDLNEKHYEWPLYTEVRAYRERVRACVETCIEQWPLSPPINWQHPFWIIMMGIEHERIHLETSSVLIRQLPLELLECEPKHWAICTDTASTPTPENELLEVSGGAVNLGKSHDDPFYGWDCEYGKAHHELEPFKAARYLVSNAQYLQFIDDGGYENPEFWDEEGWSWKTFEKAESPRFWRRKKDGSWSLRTLFKEIPMPWTWPAETNCLEAMAFCKWLAKRSGKAIRLPSEAEWHQLLAYAEVPEPHRWGSETPANLNLAGHASPCPVNVHGFKHGFCDLIGNVWQHTLSPIASHSGFAVHPLYDDFSMPTFDTRHNLIKGGCWISTGNEILRSARYGFRRHFYQHAGFRYIESKAPVAQMAQSRQTDTKLCELCEAHWGPDALQTPNYSQGLAEHATKLAKQLKLPRNRALELGAEAGRVSFELAKSFASVSAMDASASTIALAVELQNSGRLLWQTPIEGDIMEFREATLEAFGLAKNAEKIECFQADIANMKPIYRDYDLIVVNGMLERSYKPENFLKSVHERLNPNGLLIIACTQNWDTQYTETNNWLGGRKDDGGENRFSEAYIQELLGEHFEPYAAALELPRVRRQHARAFAYQCVRVQSYQKKA